MRCTVDRQDFAFILQKAKQVIEKRSALPITSCFLLHINEEKLYVKGTNLEVYITARISIQQTDKNGAVVVNADKLTSIVKSLPSAYVQLELNNGKLILTGGRSTFKLTTLDPEDFPEFPSPQTSTEFPAMDLLKAIDKVEYAISKEDT
ncbi:MAG: DNA polymerase III subunit beta, partial [Fervidobacterium sp.]|nr:DNA polymerase III subunit beta [Fervidobacterium sp.]